MLDVQLFDLHTFLPKPYEEALLPRLKKAHEKIQTGSGLPLRRSKAILRHWWSSASAAAIWEPAA